MNRTTRGVSFAEVAIGLIIAGIVLVPLLALYHRGGEGTVLTRDEVLAYQAAADVLAYVQLLEFDDGLLAPTSAPRDCTALPVGVSAQTVDSRFKRSLTVQTAHPAGITYRYKIVTVRVGWMSGTTERAVELPGLVFAGRRP
ncbi:MAG: hypothetical protein GX442_06800 [Candidatus Riflebacteria bacterium]|nr:hypothetical protein [Candidatus Riflebacteria bacterium]